MAMAVSCISSLGVAATAVVSSSTLSSSSSPSSSSQWRPACAPISGHSATLNAGQSLSVLSNAQMRRVVVAKVASAETPEAAEEAPAAPAITTILSEADLLKKKAKREELRRKRLVRKRKLRKKGKWPPSKMAKLKNV